MTDFCINGRFITQPVSGVQRVARQLCRALARSPAKDSFSLMIPSGAEAEADQIGLPFEIVSGLSDGLLGGVFWENVQLPEAVRNRYLVNLANRFPYGLRRGAVLMHDAHVFDLPSTYNPIFVSFYRRLYRSAVTHGLDLITVSEFSRARLSHALKADSKRWTVIRSGVDHILEAKADLSVLKKAGLLPRRYVLTVGARAKHKNFAALTSLASVLEKQGHVLAVVGDISPSVYANSPNKLGHGLKYLGRVDDDELRALFENARCFVFPSRYEGFGLPPLEAMALGCPVAVSDIAAHREACGNACVFFDSDDPQDLARQVLALSNDEVQVLRFADAGREVTRHLTWDRTAQEWIDFLSSVRGTSMVVPLGGHPS